MRCTLNAGIAGSCLHCRFSYILGLRLRVEILPFRSGPLVNDSRNCAAIRAVDWHMLDDGNRSVTLYGVPTIGTLLSLRGARGKCELAAPSKLNSTVKATAAALFGTLESITKCLKSSQDLAEPHKLAHRSQTLNLIEKSRVTVVAPS